MERNPLRQKLFLINKRLSMDILFDVVKESKGITLKIKEGGSCCEL